MFEDGVLQAEIEISAIDFLFEQDRHDVVAAYDYTIESKANARLWFLELVERNGK